MFSIWSVSCIDLEVTLKIHIIGGAGSGKSYIASKISKLYGINHYDLDNIFWSNSSTTYGVKTDESIRDKNLNEIVLQKSWIIEGVYYKWCYPSFEAADKIFILRTHRYIQSFRILKRFLKRKLRIVPSKKRETLSGVIALLKWNKGYNTEKYAELKEYLEKYNDKVMIVNKSSEILEYF